MPKQIVLKPGTVVWVPCELKTGIFPTEQGVKIEVNTPETTSYEKTSFMLGEGDFFIAMLPYRSVHH